MPPPDPNAPPSGIQGLLGNLFPGNNPAALYQGALTDPATQQQLNQRGLLAMAGSFADSAMPTRIPTPFGAVLGHAAAAMGPAEDAVMAARLQNAQAQQQLALSQFTQQKVNLLPQFQSALQAYAQIGDEGARGSPTASIIPPATIPGGAVVPGAGPAPYGGGRNAMFTPEQISAAALKNNLDPELVNTVVGIESSHGANIDNKISPSNTGLFQMAPANKPGGMNDTPENQLQIGINALAKEKADLEAQLGRPASNAEVYLAHQQGVAGAVALLTNPAKPAGEVTRPINISNNGGNPNLPASVFTDYWNNRYSHFAAPYTTQAPVRVASAGPVTGLLNAPPVAGVPPGAAPPAAAGAVPPLSPETKQFMRDKGMSEEAIARADGAIAGPPPAAIAAAPAGGTPPAGAAPGAIPGAPSAAKIRAAQQLNWLWPMVYGTQAPPEIAETASWDIKTAEALRDAQIKLGSTALAVRPGGGVSIGGAAPPWAMPTPTTVFNPATGRPEIANVTQLPGQPPTVRFTGIPSGASPAETAYGTAAGTGAATLGPSYPTAPPGTVPPGAPSTPGTPAVSPDKPTESPFGILPPLSEQKLPASIEEAKSLIPANTTKITDWTNRVQPAQQAEMRMMSIANAFKAIQTGTWASERANITAALDSVGIHLDPNIVNDPAQVQLVLHQNILSTLPLLKEATARPTQTEFAVTRENREGPNIQPAANLEMLAEDLALMRQTQNLPNAYYASGWSNPIQFESAYLSRNKLNPLVESIKQEIGPLKGMPGWVPPGLPPGATPTGRTYKGKPIYNYTGPDGKPAQGTFE